MGVYIKGMEMPTCCDECVALDEYGDYPVCRITQEQRGYNFRTREKRMDKCPLVEVPPHGRWIERPYLLGTSRFCSLCGENYGMPHGIYNYCPNCGADMRKAEP